MTTSVSPAPYRVGIILVPVLIFMLLVRPYVFKDVVGEGDLVRIANGLLLGHKIGFWNTLDMHYGISFSFGYYWFAYHILPASMFATASDVIAFINESGYLCAGLTLLFAGAALGRLYGYAAGAVAVTLIGFSPMFLEMATSGHPLLPGAALLFAAAWLFLVAEDTTALGIRWPLFCGAGALVFASLTVRGETALALPFLVCAIKNLSWTKTARDKALLRAAAIASAFLVFLYLRGFYQAPGQHGALDSLTGFLSAFYIARNAIKGVAGLFIGAGMVSCAAIGVAFVLCRRRHAVPALLALLLIVPNLVFWLPNGFPVRHFFFALVGGAMFLGVVAQAMVPASLVKPVLAAALLAVLNQLLAEAAYPAIIQKYEWNYEQIGDRRATFQVPLGMFQRNHTANQTMFSTLRTEAKQLANLRDPHIVVFADHSDYILLSLIDSTPLPKVVLEPAPGITWELVRGNQIITLIEKYHQWPADVMGDYIKSRDVRAMRFYVQPTTRSRYDKTEPPNEVMLHEGASMPGAQGAGLNQTLPHCC